MGEKKQKWYALARQECICGSGRVAGECCWTAKDWFKAPAKINLTATGLTGSHKRCYLRKLNSCSEQLSGEHMISASVLKQLTKSKLRVAGMPWQEDGDAREVGIGSLVSNCLCTTHNNALSPLDSVAGRFYASVQELLFNDTPTKRHCLFSGHDVERWLLKTVAGLAAAKSLGANGLRLSGVFEEGIDVAQLLQDPTAWRPPMGIYVLQKHNDLIKQSDQLGVAPLVTHQGEIAGLLTQLHGLTIALLIGQRETIKGSSLAAAPYRLMYLNANKADGRYCIELSWVSRLG